jgi:hypothetical protein
MFVSLPGRVHHFTIVDQPCVAWIGNQAAATEAYPGADRISSCPRKYTHPHHGNYIYIYKWKSNDIMIYTRMISYVIYVDEYV